MANDGIQKRYDNFINILNSEFQWPLQWCDGAKGESYKKLGSIAREYWPGRNNEKWFNTDNNSLENGLRYLYDVAKDEYNHIFTLVYDMSEAIARNDGGSIRKSTKKFGNRTRLANYQGAMQTGAGFKEDGVKKLQNQLNYMFQGLIEGERTTGGKLKQTKSSIDYDKIHEAFIYLIGNRSSSSRLNAVWGEIEEHINWMNFNFMAGAEALYNNRWDRLVTFADSYYGSSTTSKSYYGKAQKIFMLTNLYSIGDSVTLKTKLKQPNKKTYKKLASSSSDKSSNGPTILNNDGPTILN